MASPQLKRAIPGAIEIIPDRLYWVSAQPSLLNLPLKALGAEYEKRVHTFNIDQELVYQSFNRDFGPLSLGMTYRYCVMLEAMLKDPALEDKVLVHCCSTHYAKRANAAFLIGAYQVFVNGQDADVAYKPFEGIKPAFTPFCDATNSRNQFELTIKDALKGLQKGIDLGWVDYRTFDLRVYEYFEKVDNGDMNWIVPGKFLAFAGPSERDDHFNGHVSHTPEDYCPHFRNGRIGLVIRLNNKQYDRQRFIKLGIRHADLYFPDGSCPTDEIINKFLQITEAEPGAVAVHCKAGLGRTGTLIGLYSMKHYGFSARAYIGWNRICRPGSVLGIQQQFLVSMEPVMLGPGSEESKKQAGGGKLPPVNASEAERGTGDTSTLRQQLRRLSVKDDVLEREDVGQGERLCEAKAKRFIAGPGPCYDRVAGA